MTRPAESARHPHLVFLHGIGNGVTESQVRAVLDTSLQAAGYPALDGVQVVAPRYAGLLRSSRSEDESEIPAITIKELKGAEATAHRHEVALRTSRLEALLGASVPRAPLNWAPAGGLVRYSPLGLDQARVYLAKNSRIRARLLHDVVAAFPTSGRVVVVAHSLGSLIALDALLRISPQVQVDRLITIGSPLPHAHFRDRFTEWAQPPRNVSTWVNVRGSHDVITFFGGIGGTYGWALDRTISLMGHRAEPYLATEPVAIAVGDALFGSRSTELVRPDSLPDIPLNQVETQTLLEVGFAHCVLDQLTEHRPEAQDRYRRALSLTQATRANSLARTYAEAGLPVPGAMSEFVTANRTIQDPPTRPGVPQLLHTGDALPVLVSLATSNPVHPYEVDTGDTARREALKTLTARMGLTSSVGRQVSESLSFAQKSLRAKSSPIRWALIGVGAVAVVAGTGGLALAAAPVAAGAGAITGALASFGPGTMAAGLLTAGSLTGSGAAAITRGLMSTTTVQNVEQAVLSLVALSHARAALGVQLTSDCWNLLLDMESGVLDQIRVHEVLSDPKSPIRGELEQKRKMIAKAKTLLLAEGLGPEEMAGIES